MIEYLKLHKLDNGYHLIFRITYNDFDETCFMWIDGFTANGFLEVLKEKPFKHIYGYNFKYYFAGYGAYREDKYGEHTIEIRLGSKRTKRVYKARMLFIQNLRWLLDINEAKDLKPIKYPPNKLTLLKLKMLKMFKR